MTSSFIGLRRGRPAALRSCRGSRRACLPRGRYRDAGTISRSHSPITSFILCSTSTTVRSSASARISRIITVVSSGDMPAVGSSISSSTGSLASAIAISSARCCPCARSPAMRSRTAASPTRSSSASARSISAVIRERRRSSAKRVARICAATRTFSCAVSWPNTVVIWKLFAMPMRANSCCARPVMSRPWKRMRPAVGANAPLTMLKNVLLPAPFGPMIAVRRPGSNDALTSSSAVKRPKRCVTRSTSSSAALTLFARRRRRRASHRVAASAAAIPRCLSGRTARTARRRRRRPPSSAS